MKKAAKPLFTALALLVLASLGTGPARADAVISGPGCVIDGNTLQVGGKTKDGKCWGGIDVRLHGSIAPQLNDTCKDGRGNAWQCGKVAKETLRRLVRRRPVSCYHIDGEFQDMIPVVTCISGRTDLALEMVNSGMAKALHDQTKRYELEEAQAKKTHRGLWR